MWRAHAWTLWLLAAVVLAPLAILEIAGMHFESPIDTNHFDPGGLVVNLLVILVFEVGSAELEAAAAEKMVGSDFEHRPLPGMRQFVRELPWWRLIFATLLFEMALALGFVLLVVPGILVTVYWMLYGPVIVRERTTIRAAFRRSRELVRGNFWPVLVVTLIGVAVSEGAVGITTTLLHGSADWLHVLGDYVVDVLLTPIQGVGVAVVYFTLASAERRRAADGESADRP